MENLKQRTLHVENMTCPGCPKTINDGLLELDGVKDVKADFASGTVDVFYDLMKINLEQIEIKLNEMGYTIHESVIGNIKKSIVHFTEENEKSNNDAVPRPCCTAYKEKTIESMPPWAT